MGNSSSNKRDRAYSSDADCPASPCKDDKVFEFGTGTRRKKLQQQSSIEEYSDAFKESKEQEMRSQSATVPSAASGGEMKFPTVFKWDGGGKEVYISGSFSNWKPIPMVNSHGEFGLILDVPEGDHQYKFQVDGQWIHAPNQPTVDNDMGTKNNVISVKECDFEVFEALAVDSNSSKKSSSASGSPPGSYSQETPPYRSFDKSVGPPILPPQLLEVILNKDVAMNSEPILLPEPNHVMLNHLYALSIKEGVMVLSATLRYKKKYVTTLLYKPI